MWLLNKSEHKSSSRRQMQIKEFRDNVLVLPNREYRLALETSAINFELMSEAEQDVLIDGFQTFLNALPCAVQILVRIREVDIDSYLTKLNTQKQTEAEAVYQHQIDRYRAFIERLVAGNKILARKFYVILAYQPGHKVKDFSVIKEQLHLQRDIVIRGLEKLGVHARMLNTLEFMDLFYSFYNPSQAKTQMLSNETLKQLIAHTYA